MAEKNRVCKECGTLSKEKVCPNCGAKAFLDKYKGTALIVDKEKSTVAERLGVEKGGKYAMKFGN